MANFKNRKSRSKNPGKDSWSGCRHHCLSPDALGVTLCPVLWVAAWGHRSPSTTFRRHTMIGRILAGVVLCGLVASASLQAHHSLAGVYDLKKEQEVKGTLTRVAFTNPHGVMHIAVKNEDGSTTDWILTTASPSTLAALGFGNNGPNQVHADHKVAIKIFPALSGKPLGFIRSITLANKKEVQISTGSSRD